MPTIRRLLAEDYDAVIALWQASGLRSLRAEGRDSRPSFEKQISGGQVVLGLEDDGKLIGVVVATHDTRKGWINRLAIDPHHRRRGYGRALHRAAEKLLLDLGITVIAVLVEEWNEPSLRFLEKEGFTLHRDILYLTKKYHFGG